ncbi:MAG: hypothetical protein ACRD1K_12445, partial [Acidimicrobiales bacterium]
SGTAGSGATRPPTPDPADLGDVLARELWRVALAGRRWPRRDIAPGSPLEALFGAYGHRALLLAFDLPEGLPLRGVRAVTFPSQRGRAEVTTGWLAVAGTELPFTLRWRLEGTRARPGEVLAHFSSSAALAAARTLPPARRVAVAGLPPAGLDPVATAVWGLLAGDGLAVLARGLAAWRRLDDHESLGSLDPGEAAALVVDAVRSWPRGNPVADALGTPDWWAR